MNHVFPCHACLLFAHVPKLVLPRWLSGTASASRAGVTRIEPCFRRSSQSSHVKFVLLVSIWHYRFEAWTGLPDVSTLTIIKYEGSRPEWCFSSMIYSRDTPFWSETLARASKFYLLCLYQCGSTYNCLRRSIPMMHFAYCRGEKQLRKNQEPAVPFAQHVHLGFSLSRCGWLDLKH